MGGQQVFSWRRPARLFRPVKGLAVAQLAVTLANALQLEVGVEDFRGQAVVGEQVVVARNDGFCLEPPFVRMKLPEKQESSMTTWTSVGTPSSDSLRSA